MGGETKSRLLVFRLRLQHGLRGFFVLTPPSNAPVMRRKAQGLTCADRCLRWSRRFRDCDSEY